MYLKIDDSLDDDLRLWRYIDLAKLISLFEKKAIWLARADGLFLEQRNQLG